MHSNQDIIHIGCGYWGQNIARSLQSLGALHSVCDLNSSLAKGFAKEINTKVISFDDALSSEARGITLATPAENHFESGLQVLSAGKNLYIEKPVTLNLSEAIELKALAKKNGLIVQVGHLLLYHEAFRVIKKLIDTQFLGEIIYIYSNRLSWGKIRKFENIFWSFAPHDISLLNFLIQESLTLKNFYSSKLLGNNIEDVGHIFLSSNSGINCHINVSWLHPIKEHKLTIIGQKKSVQFIDDGRDFIEVFSNEEKIITEEKLPSLKKEKMFFNSKELPLTIALKSFISSIKNNTTPLASIDNGIEVVKILEEIEKKK